MFTQRPTDSHALQPATSFPSPLAAVAPTPTPTPRPTSQALADYLDRVARYVPVEIIAAFLAIRAFVASEVAMPAALEIVLFAGLVLLTPLYLIKLGGYAPRKGLQVAIATLSFVVWAYAIGGPFFWEAIERLSGAEIEYPAFGGAFAVIWSLAVGLVRPEPSQQRRSEHLT